MVTKLREYRFTADGPCAAPELAPLPCDCGDPACGVDSADPLDGTDRKYRVLVRSEGQVVLRGDYQTEAAAKLAVDAFLLISQDVELVMPA
jgi:hypothetical protein